MLVPVHIKYLISSVIQPATINLTQLFCFHSRHQSSIVQLMACYYYSTHSFYHAVRNWLSSLLMAECIIPTIFLFLHVIASSRLSSIHLVIFTYLYEGSAIRKPPDTLGMNLSRGTRAMMIQLAGLFVPRDAYFLTGESMIILLIISQILSHFSQLVAVGAW